MDMDGATMTFAVMQKDGEAGMIDREKIIKGLECCSESSGYGCNYCPYGDECRKLPMMGCAHLCRDVLELLKEQQEQKHGHWFYDPDGMDWGIPAWRCSECRCRNDNIPPNLERMNPLRWSGSKYCPNCGATMDEEVMTE